MYPYASGRSIKKPFREKKTRDLKFDAALRGTDLFYGNRTVSSVKHNRSKFDPPISPRAGYVDRLSSVVRVCP